ncbi:MAG TPA: hypothetical protein DCL61_21695, partial [Cyanobacteria bacterium UBA12227]|nr:hypothetical protein [Cyanobacteria bacterium UBA12227]
MQGTISRVFGSSLLIAGVALTTSTLIANPAQAFIVNFGANSESSNTPATGSSATIDFNFTNVMGGVKLDLLVTNTTGQVPSFGAGATESSLMRFVFDVPDAVTNVSLIDDGIFTTFIFNSNNIAETPFSNNGASFGAFNGGFDVELSRGGNPNNALTEGNSTLVSLLLSSASNAASLEQLFFDGIFADDPTDPDEALRVATRFQAVNGGSNNGASDKLLQEPGGDDEVGG